MMCYTESAGPNSALAEARDSRTRKSQVWDQAIGSLD